jgi:PPOX class probable F420-dependent enzyme
MAPTAPGSDPAHARYVSLATRRRDGREVRTPVWIAADDSGVLYLFSAGEAGKVKRIRNDGSVRLAPCTYRGEVTGAWQSGRARIVDDPATVARAYAALRAKYGWQMCVGDVFSRLTGRFHRRAIIAIEPG